MLKKLPLGLQSFRKIITEGYVYVDKTQFIYYLLAGAGNYFLSRPRRFGKSLLLDTISEVFSGDKELFKGLWLYDSDYTFAKHPVIRLDLSSLSNKSPEALENSLALELHKRIAEEELKITASLSSDLFKFLIEGLCQKYSQRVVVLIDEYDKPILDHISDVELAEANRTVLHSFYGILKSMDAHLKFVLITGVSKFTKTSIFSGLNNLKDLTLARDYANICGVTLEEFDAFFHAYIERLASLDEFAAYDNVREEILAWYDGYSWDGKTKLLNPYSLLSCLDLQTIESFWYASGTPKFLIDLLKQKPESFLELRNLKIRERVLDSFDVRSMEIEPLLFQTGYLTLKEVIYTKHPPVYVLDLPNQEVSEAFNLQIIAAFTGRNNTFTDNAYLRLAEALAAGDLKQVRDTLRGLFAAIPYQLQVNQEAYYHSIFYAVMRLLGFDLEAEVSVARGRIDAVLELNDKVYIIEFKYKQSPPEASAENKQKLFAAALAKGMAQIKDRGYPEKYAGSGKTVYLAAFAFLGRDEIEMCVEQL